MEIEKMKLGKNFHDNAAVLILSAAEKSGLLQEIAQVLCYVDKTHYDEPDGTVAREFCLPCALLADLAEAFDGHILLASCLLEDFHGEGFDPPEAAEEEVAPYLGFSSALSTPTPSTPSTSNS